MENQEKKEVLIYQNEIWQDGYESAIIDLRFRLAQAYSANNRNAIRDMIMYLYRKIDFNNMLDWSKNSLWSGNNLD